MREKKTTGIPIFKTESMKDMTHAILNGRTMSVTSSFFKTKKTVKIKMEL